MILKLTENKRVYKRGFIEVALVDMGSSVHISIYNWENVMNPIILGRTINTPLKALDERKEITRLMREVQLIAEDETIDFEQENT